MTETQPKLQPLEDKGFDPKSRYTMRHLGMMFVTRSPTYPGLSSQFASKAAFGDLVTTIIAFVAIPLVLSGSGLAKPAVWVFNIIGTVELLVAITTARIYNAPPAMGSTYCIPALWVPALLVTHYSTFLILTKHWR